MASRPIQILLVAAHPADSFDMAGGTLAHHVDQGDQVTAAILTTGVSLAPLGTWRAEAQGRRRA